MIEPVDLVGAVAWGGVAGALMTLGAGIRRIPWRHGLLAGAGWGVVFAALRAATLGADPAILVLFGAIGGSLTMHGWDRGMRERRRISDQMTAIGTAPPA